MSLKEYENLASEQAIAGHRISDLKTGRAHGFDRPATCSSKHDTGRSIMLAYMIKIDFV